MEFFNDTLDNLLEELIDYRGKTPTKTTSGIPLVTAKIIKNGVINEFNEFIAEHDYDGWMVRGFPKQGDVAFLDFNPTKGHEQKGFRLAVVISNDVFIMILQYWI